MKEITFKTVYVVYSRKGKYSDKTEHEAEIYVLLNCLYGAQASCMFLRYITG